VQAGGRRGGGEQRPPAQGPEVARQQPPHHCERGHVDEEPARGREEVPGEALREARAAEAAGPVVAGQRLAEVDPRPGDEERQPERPDDREGGQRAPAAPCEPAADDGDRDGRRRPREPGPGEQRREPGAGETPPARRVREQVMHRRGHEQQREAVVPEPARGRAPHGRAEADRERDAEAPAQRQCEARGREGDRHAGGADRGCGDALDRAIAGGVVAAVGGHGREAERPQQRHEREREDRAARRVHVVEVPANLADLVGQPVGTQARMALRVEGPREVGVELEAAVAQQLLAQQHRVGGVGDLPRRGGEEGQEARRHERGDAGARSGRGRRVLRGGPHPLRTLPRGARARRASCSRSRPRSS
jgi:hypothetical protein